MKPSEAFDRHRDAIRQIVAAHHAGNPRVFGSVVAGEDRADSDLDLLIDASEDMTLFDLGAIRHELKALLGVPVDVLTPGALPARFRASVLATAQPV
jgi:predicted nucleotidyltransferase